MRLRVLKKPMVNNKKSMSFSHFELLFECVFELNLKKVYLRLKVETNKICESQICGF